MKTMDINGVQVNFPFTPYPCQVDYMGKVLTCLQKNQNGVLESPTGTGKTLSLLCASLAWQEGRKAQVELNKQSGIAAACAREGDNPVLTGLVGSLEAATGSSWGSEEFLVPKIIYASRTHSQLSQAVQELKRTTYSSVKTSVIGSREQLCIHQQVQKQTSNAAKVQMCRSKVTSRQCHFYNNIEDFKKKSDSRKAMGNVVDIEDIVRFGHKSKTCPYYMARELKTDADIVFMPYNYLLDPKSRKAHGIELQGSIIIFDEAHNLEKICEESASFDLSSLDLATAIEECTKLAEKVADLSSREAELAQVEDSVLVPEFTLEDIVRLKKTLLEIEEKIENIEVPSSQNGKTLDGSFIFELLSQVNITWSTKNQLLEVLDRMTTFLGNDESNAILNTKGAGLTKFADCLKSVFSQEPREMASLSSHQRVLSQHYKVHIQKKDADDRFKKKIDSWSTSAEKKAERILSYWCFSPGHTMRELVAHGVKVIILTSGTLSPLDSFALEMQIPFPVRLENPHVIDKEQVWLGAICKGPDGTTLNSEYKNRANADYQNSLGNTIRNFARMVPNGMLVFFPSYPVMDMCITKWKDTNQWNVINQYKAIIVEPKGKTAFTEAMDEFYTKVNDPSLSGAIFMAVCRGKVSEGLDFADTNGRAVLITGLPFPPRFDARVRLKMEFLRENKNNFKGLDGNTWYRQQATRAVNQAIGRVIRHKKDYGAILLCDTRFSSMESKNGLPRWVRDQARVYSQFGLALRDVIKFFREAQKTYPLTASDLEAVKQRSIHRTEDSGIVTGACFEPSFSRKSQGRSHTTLEYERASDVACHMPSLTGTEADVNSQYRKAESGDARPARPAKKRSLLEALEQVETTPLPSSCDTSESATVLTSQIPSFQVPQQKKLPGRQKRIRIQETKPEIVVTKPGEGKAKVSQMKSQLSVKSSQDYVTDVKSVLSSESYKRFGAVLAKYKTDRHIHDVVPELADLFTGSPHNYHLFQRFFKFVRPEDKAYYARTCLELTGLVCDMPKVKAASTKDGENATTSSSSSIKPSVGSTCDKAEPSTSGKQSDVDCTEFRGYLPLSKQSSTVTVFHQLRDGQTSAHSSTINPSSHCLKRQTQTLKLWDSADEKETFTYDATSVHAQLAQEGALDPDIFPREMFLFPRTWEEAKYACVGNRTFQKFPKGETILDKCVMCNQPPRQGLRHECGAVGCFLCWKRNVFEGPPERKCPYPHCGLRVQRKYLQHVNAEDR